MVSSQIHVRYTILIYVRYKTLYIRYKNSLPVWQRYDCMSDIPLNLMSHKTLCMYNITLKILDIKFKIFEDKKFQKKIEVPAFFFNLGIESPPTLSQKPFYFWCDSRSTQEVEPCRIRTRRRMEQSEQMSLIAIWKAFRTHKAFQCALNIFRFIAKKALWRIFDPRW